MAGSRHERIPSMAPQRAAIFQRFEGVARPLLPRMSETRRQLAEGGLQQARGLTEGLTDTFQRSFLLYDIAQLAKGQVSPLNIMSRYMKDQLNRVSPYALNPLFHDPMSREIPITLEEARILARTAEVVDYAEKVLDFVEISGRGESYKGGSTVYFGKSGAEPGVSFPLPDQPNPWADRPGDRLPEPRQDAVALLLNEFGGLPLTLTARQAEALTSAQPNIPEEPSASSSSDEFALRTELLKVSDKLDGLPNLVAKTPVKNLYLVYSPSNDHEYYAAGFLIPSEWAERVMADALPDFPLS